MISIQILEKELHITDIERQIQDDSCGGLVYFVGSVRNNTKARPVTHLEFEAYKPMAIKEMHGIGMEAVEKFNAKHVAIYHRIGKLYLGEFPVIIGVSCPHRKAAFDACEFIINSLKSRVPIWKREYFIDGSVWVSATP